MSWLELMLLAVGLSMDAFAVAVCAGLTMTRVTLKKAFIVGLYFGVFQAVMPAIGYVAASLFASYIIDFDHWIAFGLLAYLGGRMVLSSFKREEAPEQEASLKASQMLPLAVATSIDALAVGVSLAFLKVSIVPAASFIGVTTLLLSMAGVKIGQLFGMKFKAKAEFAGGVILILIGVKILLEHLGILTI